MKRKRFSVEQIVAFLKQAELGLPVADLVRQTGISEQTFYRWKKQYAGLESTQVREFKQLSEENARLKKLVADLSLDKAVLQDVLSNNVWSAPSVQGSRSFRRCSLLKCIRPLASGPLLRPGHDEIRTCRSQKMVRARSPFFCTGFTTCRSTVSSSLSRTSQSELRRFRPEWADGVRTTHPGASG
jgi:putative transposase